MELYLYKNKKQYYYESKETILERVRSFGEHSIPRFYTWLTIENYIVDFVLKHSKWYVYIKNGKQIENKDIYKVAFRNRIAGNLSCISSDEPLFLGIDYFNKVRFKYRIEKLRDL